jgi:outer membrane receptor protein involved in Fe transport
LDFKLRFEKTRNSSFFIGAAYFGESRENGTPFQTNRTHLRQFRFGGDWESRLGAFGLRIYTSTQVFDQNFSAVSADRNSETPTRVQRVPAQVTGLTLQWSRAFGKRQTIVGGLDGRGVRGSSDELAFSQGRPSSSLGAGGRERDSGLFIKDILRLTPRVTIIGGARFDYWRNFLAHADTSSLSPGGPSTVLRFKDRSETAFSPQLSFVYRFDSKIDAFGSIYRGFRAPTLNELYRSFRVGNILTLANAALRAEQLGGVEGGLSFSSANSRFALRSSLFRSVIDHSIANVTLRTAPDLITRERQNLGSTRSQGLEVETEMRIDSHWSLTGSYLFADATVLRFPPAPSLEGLSVPQIPRHSLAIQVRYMNPQMIDFGLQARIVGSQFDDDLNQFPLPRYFNVDAIVSRHLSHNLEAFAAAENLFNQRYVVGRTPITTLGPPALIRAGIRLRFPTR